MSIQETHDINRKEEKSKWGAANMACSTHEQEIRTLQDKGWPLKLIWKHLQDVHKLSVTYDAFRKALIKRNARKTSTNDTAETGGARLHELRSDSVSSQNTEKEVKTTPAENATASEDGGRNYSASFTKFKLKRT
jgi:hypothetical protein